MNNNQTMRIKDTSCLLWNTIGLLQTSSFSKRLMFADLLENEICENKWANECPSIHCSWSAVCLNKLPEICSSRNTIHTLHATNTWSYGAT